MVNALYESDPDRYAGQVVVIPEALRRQFESVHQMPRHLMAERLMGEIGIGGELHSALQCRVMQVLIEALANVVREEPPEIEHRGIEVTDKVLDCFTLPECLTIAEHFGWSETQLPKGTPLKDADRLIRQLVSEKLGKPLNRALEAWAKRGWLGWRATSQ